MAERVFGTFSVVRRLPAPFETTRIVASGKVGGLKFIFKRSSAWDAELLRIAQLLVHRSDVVWDVGANVGLFSLAAASLVGESGSVLAIEADFDAVSLLHKSRVLLSGDQQLRILPAAVADKLGVVEFAISNRARASNSIAGLGSTQTGGVSETRLVPSFALDDLLQVFPKPNVLKIDVEGAELLVLNGSTRLLSEVRPAIYCEVSCSTAEKVTDLLTSAGYRLWDGATFSSSSDDPISKATFNTVALPVEYS
jgi:FkbM family methyltransferase